MSSAMTAFSWPTRMAPSKVARGIFMRFGPLQQLVLGEPGYPAEALVHLEVAAVQGDDRHPEQGVLKRRTEPRFALAQRLFGPLPVRNVVGGCQDTCASCRTPPFTRSQRYDPSSHLTRH